MKQIAEGLYAFTGLMVGRVYLIEDADGLTIIDASIPPAAAKILGQITAMGRAPADVKRILITHAHPDHVGGLPELKRGTGAQVIASAADRPLVEGKVPIPLPPVEELSGRARRLRPAETTLAGTPVDREIQDGETLRERLKATYPSAGVCSLHGVGHFPYLNEGEAYTRLIERFLVDED